MKFDAKDFSEAVRLTKRVTREWSVVTYEMSVQVRRTLGGKERTRTLVRYRVAPPRRKGVRFHPYESAWMSALKDYPASNTVAMCQREAERDGFVERRGRR